MKLDISQWTLGGRTISIQKDDGRMVYMQVSGLDRDESDRVTDRLREMMPAILTGGNVTELERLKELVKAQDKLILALDRFLCSMPFCIDDLIPDYRELADEIERLSRKQK